MSVRVSCPFCNATFTPPAGRAICPRCGELVPVTVHGEDDGEPGDVSPPEVSVPSSGGLTSPGSPRRRIILVAVALGLVALGIGVGVLYSRGHKPRPNPESDAITDAVTAPAELAGLGYLPADCNLVFAVQTGPLLAYATRTNQEPRELLAKAGVPDAVFATLGRLGLTLPQIDHIAGGTRIGDAEQEVRLALVLVLRRAADEDVFLPGLGAKKVPGPKARFHVTFAGLPMLMAKASETVWVFGLDEKDLAPAERGGGKPQLSPGLREMLAERLPPDAAVWAAADRDRWAEKPFVKLAARGQKHSEWLPVIARGQAAVAGLSFGEQPRLRVFVRCVDGDTGEKLRAYFQSKAADEAIRTGGAGEWAMFDAPADPRNGLQTVRQWLDDAGK